MSYSPAARPIAEGLFTWPAAEPQLLGSRCNNCDRADFPARASCSACCSDDVTVEALPGRGTLWTWTVQRFLPKSPYNRGETPETFEPYGVGYLELPGAVRVEGRLTENDPAKLRVGMPMKVVFPVWKKDANGEDIVTFAFKPLEGDA